MIPTLSACRAYSITGSIPTGSDGTPISMAMERSTKRRATSDRLLALPVLQLLTRAVLGRVHVRVVPNFLAGQLDDVAVGIAEVDGVDHAVIGWSANLLAGRLGPVEPGGD